MSTRRILSCLFLPAYLSSCTSWQVQGISPRQVVEEEQPSQIRVTTTSDSEILLDRPRVSGDSLIGIPRTFSWASSTYTASDSLLSIPLASISQVSIKKPSDVNTVVLIVLVPLGALFIWKMAHHEHPFASPLNPLDRIN